MKNEYITSERFIHDDLMARAHAMVEKLPGMWGRDGHIFPMLFTWPSEAVATSGGRHEGICVLELEGTPRAEWSALLRKAVAATKAYGLLLVEQQEREVVVIFETHHGSRAWRLPVKRHGDRCVLEKPRVSTDVESVGILWSPQRATA